MNKTMLNQLQQTVRENVTITKINNNLINVEWEFWNYLDIDEEVFLDKNIIEVDVKGLTTLEEIRNKIIAETYRTFVNGYKCRMRTAKTKLKRKQYQMLKWVIKSNLEKAKTIANEIYLLEQEISSCKWSISKNKVFVNSLYPEQEVA